MGTRSSITGKQVEVVMKRSKRALKVICKGDGDRAGVTTRSKEQMVLRSKSLRKWRRNIEVFLVLFVDSCKTLKPESLTCISLGNFRNLCPVSRCSIAHYRQICKSVCLEEHLNSIHLVLSSTFGKYTFKVPWLVSVNCRRHKNQIRVKTHLTKSRLHNVQWKEVSSRKRTIPDSRKFWQRHEWVRVGGNMLLHTGGWRG